MSADFVGHSDAFYPGDIIYAVNDGKVGSVAELEAALRVAQRGETVAVQVERLGQLQFLGVEIQ